MSLTRHIAAERSQSTPCVPLDIFNYTPSLANLPVRLQMAVNYNALMCTLHVARQTDYPPHPFEDPVVSHPETNVYQHSPVLTQRSDA